MKMLLFSLFFFFAASHAKACSINLDTNSPTNPPHVIDSNNQIVEPVLIDKARILVLPAGQVTLACTGTGNTLTATGQQINSATCASDTSLKLSTGKTVAFNSLGCSSAVRETVKEAGKCYNGATLVQIGWQVDSTFINQITVCHDKITANTLYASDQISGASITADDTTNPRPSFKKGNFYSGVSTDTAYSQSGQAAVVGQIVGSTSLAAQYINVAKSYYFARGHFSPDGDFIDAASQDATYYYINVAPQWQSFNNGNWKAVETAVRAVAAARSRTLTTYTGGYGLLTLADTKGKQQPIYLAFDANNNGLIPAPKYYWKVVHDPVAKTAVAFVGINNPHLTSVSAADVFCTDVCAKVTWAALPNRMSIPAGYTFCCSVAELKKVVPYAPDLGNLALLV